MQKLKRYPSLRLSAMLIVVTMQGENLSAEDLHVWTDQEGRRNISTIPPEGFDKRGRLRKQYDPNSIRFQHYQMLRSLETQARKLQLEQGKESEPAMVVSDEIIPSLRAPKEGIMGLRELIRLERRGGRYLER